MESSKVQRLVDVSALFILDSIADFLSVTGTLSSIVAGASMAISFQLNQNVSVDYYANGDIVADASADLSVASCKSHHTDFINNVNLLDQKYTGNMNFNIANYISKQYIQNFIITTMMMGILLKTVANVLHVWTQSRKDESASNKPFFIKPSWNEYGNQTIHSVLSSSATCSITAMIVSTTICLEQLNFQYDYPIEGIKLIDGNGISRLMQVLSDEAGKIFQFKPFNISLYPGFSESTLLNLTIHANIKTLLAFGATVYNEEIKSGKPLLYSPSTITALSSTAASIILYPAGRFFKSKAEQERVKRLESIALMNKENTVALIDDTNPTTYNFLQV